MNVFFFLLQLMVVGHHGISGLIVLPNVVKGTREDNAPVQTQPR